MSRPTLLAFALTLLWQVAAADGMECPGGILDTAEVDPPTPDVVLRLCGEPAERQGEGRVWVYRRGQFSYVLSFDERGNLYMIQQQD
jgi:hypothetical protein